MVPSVVSVCDTAGAVGAIGSGERSHADAEYCCIGSVGPVLVCSSGALVVVAGPHGVLVPPITSNPLFGAVGSHGSHGPAFSRSSHSQMLLITSMHGFGTVFSPHWKKTRHGPFGSVVSSSLHLSDFVFLLLCATS